MQYFVVEHRVLLFFVLFFNVSREVNLIKGRDEVDDISVTKLETHFFFLRGLFLFGVIVCFFPLVRSFVRSDISIILLSYLHILTPAQITDISI